MVENIDLGISELSDFRVVGSGGFSTVYAAWDEGFNRRVAVKVLHSLDADGRRRFDRERGIMGQLSSHPNVITPFRAGYTPNGAPYLVMELVGDGSLQDLLESRGRIPWAEAVDLVVPVTAALGYAHDHGVLHRDVKPANVLIAQGVPKLTDFGIAAIRESTASQVAYTLAHCPPEAFASGQDDRDERSDLYAMASSLYALIVGQPPFDITEPDSQQAYMFRIIGREVSPPPAGLMPPSLADVLLATLAKDPGQRPQSATEFIQRLTEVRAELDPGPGTMLAGAAPGPSTDPSLVTRPLDAAASPPTSIGSPSIANPTPAPSPTPPPMPPPTSATSPQPDTASRPDSAHPGAVSQPGPISQPGPVSQPGLVSQPGSGGQGVATPVATPPASSSRSSLVGRVAIIGLVLILAGAAAAWFLRGDEPATVAASSTTAPTTTAPSTTSPSTTSPSTTSPPTTSPSSTTTSAPTTTVAAAAAVTVDPPAEGFFRFQSAWIGADQCLDANQTGGSDHGGGAYVDGCRGTGRQQWEMVPIEDDEGRYHLRTRFWGGPFCLDGNDPDDDRDPTGANAAYMTSCATIAHQAWYLVDAGRGQVQLRTDGEDGETTCLAANDPTGSAFAGAVHLTRCSDGPHLAWTIAFDS